MPSPSPSVAGQRARSWRPGPRRALAALAVVTLATVVGTSTVAVGRAPAPPTSFDPSRLTRVVPPSPAERQAIAAPSAAPVSLEPFADFLPDDRSFAPRPQVDLPQSVGVIVRPTPTPRPKPRPQVASTGGGSSGGGSSGGATTRSYSNRVSGVSSWYCLPGTSACHYAYSGGMYAAAGPALRVGNWRGRTVRVCHGGRCVHVKLIDWCQCYGTRVIDLYSDAFRRLAPLSSGTISVTVSW